MDLLSGGLRPDTVGAAAYVVALFSTFFCTAVNCYTWRLGYPLWSKVRSEDFGALHREYLRTLNPVITVPHVVMFFSSLGLIFRRPGLMSPGAAWTVFLVNTVVILISAFGAGPIHDRFVREQRLDGPGLRLLVAISAVRSWMMLGSSALLCWSVWRALLG